MSEKQYVCGMLTTKSIILYIDQIRVEQKISKTTLCEYAGISTTMYYGYLSGDSNATFDTIMKMFDLLKIEFHPINHGRTGELLVKLGALTNDIYKELFTLVEERYEISRINTEPLSRIIDGDQNGKSSEASEEPLP